MAFPPVLPKFIFVPLFAAYKVAPPPVDFIVPFSIVVFVPPFEKTPVVFPPLVVIFPPVMVNLPPSLLYTPVEPAPVKVMSPECFPSDLLS